jgi:hypothetical protein
MKRYIKIASTRKSPPRIEGAVWADDLESAIRTSDLWPYVYPDDFYDENGIATKTYEEAFQVALEHVRDLNQGNGENGSWNQYLEVDPITGECKFSSKRVPW